MSTPPRPRPRPDSDDITAVRKPDGAEHWIDKFDGADRPDGYEFEEIKVTLTDDGSDRDGPWKHDGDDAWKIDRITEATPDASEYEEIKWTLKADGTDRDGPWKHDGDDTFKIDRSVDAHPEAQEFGVAAAEVAMVEIPELQLDDPTLETSFVSDDTDLVGADSADLGDGDLLDG
ncbi:MAG: hypothetical protein KDB40_17350 [Acidimicrobiales bacterium]|nr:hypothetical protein [Acidimicrobiales bacterium]MCB9394527.1 hypothetical protein [Acidimicrobiaceae bacterium]